jgi:hypothetical protein
MMARFRCGNEERERTGMGRKENREGVGGDVRTVRRSNTTCRERGEIRSEDEKEIRWMKESRERIEKGRGGKCYILELHIYLLRSVFCNF